MTAPIGWADRVVIVHGRPDPVLTAALMLAGLRTVIRIGVDTAVWVPDCGPDVAEMAAATPIGPRSGAQRAAHAIGGCLSSSSGTDRPGSSLVRSGPALASSCEARAGGRR